MHYTPHIDYAFNSVEHIMRDVNNGWLLRYIHANGASMMFITLYTHMFKNLYYGSYVAPRHWLWISGVLILLATMATGFIGYVLPFIIAGLSLVHLVLLHVHGNNNPLGVESKTNSIPFFPYFYVKDLFSFFCLLVFFSVFVFFFPNVLGHSDNYIPANPMVTPPHIVPEWYFLPFYAILRSIPDKLGGVLAIFAAIIVLLFLPVLHTSKVRSTAYRPLHKVFFWLFVV